MGIIKTMGWQLRDHWDTGREAKLKSAGGPQGFRVSRFFSGIKNIFSAFFPLCLTFIENLENRGTKGIKITPNPSPIFNN